MKRRHQRFERARVAYLRKQRHRPRINVVIRLDMRAFNASMQRAKDSMEAFAAAMRAALPECKRDGCTRVADGGWVFGVGRCCKRHYVAAMLRRPSLLAMRASGGISSIRLHEAATELPHDLPPTDHRHPARADRRSARADGHRS